MSGPHPKYLTISDDLQIVPSTARYLSRSGCTIDAAIRDVSDCVEANPLHPRVAAAKGWLQEAEEKAFQSGLLRMAESKRMERAAFEMLVRREVHNYLWEQKVKFADLPKKTDELTDKILKEAGY